MFGKIEFFIPLIVAIAVYGAISDLSTRKIHNWFTLPAILLGLILSTTTLGWQGLGQSFLGIGLALVLLGWMFFINVMGGGDVKFLMALGAFGGPEFIINVTVLSILVGGVMAALILLFKGQMKDFYHRIMLFFYSLGVKELAEMKPSLNQKEKMPFGVAIAIAAVWVAIDNPLVGYFS